MKTRRLVLTLMLMTIGLGSLSCSVSSKEPVKLQTETIDDVDPATGEPVDEENDTPVEENNTTNNNDDTTTETADNEPSANDAISEATPGVQIEHVNLNNIESDPTGLHISDDYDGDGIPNDQEIFSNPYIADYPRLVARISPPITMEIRVSSTSVEENHSETVEQQDFSETIKNSMEDVQYNETREKTTPYEVSTSESYGESNEHSTLESEETGSSSGGNAEVFIFGVGAKTSNNSATTNQESVANSFEESSASTTTVFEDVTYIDNLSRNGISYTNDTVQSITSNARKSSVLKKTDIIGPNAGVVRASLYLENPTVNMPARISNVVCTLTFRTAAGEFLPVKTFKLRNEDWTEFEQDIYGQDDLGPYTIEISGLNTAEVTNALKNGYLPQIHVVNYDITRVEDSNYNPGVDNLKIVEENAKGRTAQIVVSAPNYRDSFRVTAFNVEDDGTITTGISLKKALFKIYHTRMGRMEQWHRDSLNRDLTVQSDGLKWIDGSLNPNEYTYSDNTTGNQWNELETYVKVYVDENNKTVYREQIKRIKNISEVNPFDRRNGNDPNRTLTEEEILDMQYWVVMHNGRYYKGDINDPIMPGERYEIVLLNNRDFNNYFKGFSYTPLQSRQSFRLSTLWNKNASDDIDSRSIYLGKVYRDDIINVEVDLLQNRMLIDPSSSYYSGIRNNINGNIPYRLTDMYDANVYNAVPEDFRIEAQGGINSINLVIEKSVNALTYKIDIQSKSDAIFNRSIRITEKERSEKGGFTGIHRKSIDTEYGEIGLIPAGDYSVTVYAEGTLYGVNVEKRCRYIREVSVQNALNQVPGYYTYSADGGLNGAGISVSGGANTEYYVVEYEGPLNEAYLSGGGSSESGISNVSSGYSWINLPKPHDFKTFVNPGEPAVFRILVYPVNRYKDGRMENSARTEYITVPFDQYLEQKRYYPELVRDYAIFDSIDLEVNFNEGSGWIPIHFLGPKPESEYIDCRFTKYLNLKEQRFFFSFKAPSGELYDTAQNVFAGGRSNVDLYIRTKAYEKYRNRFWPLKGSDILFQFTGGITGTIKKLWVDGVNGVSSIISDATSVEDILTGSLGGVTDVINGSIEKVFFSPLSYRLFSIRTYLTTGNLVETVSEDTSFGFNAYVSTSSSNRIVVNNIDADYCDEFKVFYKQISPNDNSNFNTAEKNRIANTEINFWNEVPGGATPGETITITDLVANTGYAVALVGETRTGNYLGPVYYGTTLDNINMNSIEKLIPRNRVKPDPVENISLALEQGGGEIIVSNILSSNATSYEVQYRSIDGSDSNTSWTSTERLTPATAYSPVQVLLPTLMWNTYEIRVFAYNSFAPEGQNSSQSEVMLISTIQGDIPEIDVEYVSMTQEIEEEYSSSVCNSDHTGLNYKTTTTTVADLRVSVSNLPNNTITLYIDTKIWDANDNYKEEISEVEIDGNSQVSTIVFDSIDYSIIKTIEECKEIARDSYDWRVQSDMGSSNYSKLISLSVKIIAEDGAELLVSYDENQ
ncbi:MAG: hypothetical protein PF637_09905 [Spirochaetes bacterium]|jgi:hypothetical protein|nr:hypothetical protein [Spirochaetota bacterium]